MKTVLEAEIKHLKLLLSAAPAVTYTCNPSGNYEATFVSEYVTEMLGYRPAEFLEDPKFWVNNIHPKDVERVFNELSLLFENDFHLYEYRFRHKDGSYRWMRDEIKLIRDTDEKPLNIFGSWVDISSRKQAEIALKQSEKRYRTFVHNFQGIAYRGTTDFTPVFFHGAVEEITGYSEKDFISGTPTWDKIIFPDDLPKALEDGRKMCTIPNYSYKREYRIIRKDGRIKWVYEIVHNTCDSSGIPDFVEGAIYDITEQKGAEAELAAERERLAVTLRSIGDGVITTNIEGQIILINKVAEELTGWNQEEVTGRPLDMVFNIVKTTGEPSENPIAKVLKTSQLTGFTNHTAILVGRDNTKRTVANSGAPIKDKNNNILGVVLVFRDITDQQIIEKKIAEANHLESIGVLAGGIAHDFNNILTAILGNINLALFSEDLGDKTRNLLIGAEKASLRAKDLTQQLLTFAKGGEPVKEVSSLENVIKDSANFCLHGDKVGCQFDIPADLWFSDIDKGQISQVIQNFILNASHAMPEGGIIKVSCENIFSTSSKSIPYLKERP